MTTFENVEKLRERANVTYEEAKAALEASGNDLLDAMIYLENQGKVAPPSGGGSYSSGSAAHSAPQPEFNAENRRKTESFGTTIKRFFRFCGKLLQKGNSNSFEVWRDGTLSFCVPVTVLVILLIFAFPVIVPLMIVGLFFRFRYRFSGKDLEGTAVNRAMDGAAHVAEAFKEEVISPARGGDHTDGE